MAKTFTPKIPELPIIKRDSYEIPENYEEKYLKAGINDKNEQIILFHLTQFGGFRTKKIPKYLQKSEVVDKWIKIRFEGRDYKFKPNIRFLEQFGDIEINPLLRIWRKKAVNWTEMDENGFSQKEIKEAEEFLEQLNEYYSKIRLNIKLPNSGLTAKDRIQLSRFHGIPFLVKKPMAGGRFYHPETSYQTINAFPLTK